MRQLIPVARGSASGMWAVMGTVKQARTRKIPAVRALGLVVAASSHRPPKAVTDRVRLMPGWVPAVWRIGRHGAFPAVEDVPAPGRRAPEVATAWHGMVHTTTGSAPVILDARTGRIAEPGAAPTVVGNVGGVVAAGTGAADLAFRQAAG
ncbi:hypothetical protein [Actinoplanes utahensis]|uniref:hypothetical protein n=1 Tax=Actinoplanes utahensis TaxID=1869 RepID=UPI000AD15F98|nr:hypothetical protein [Actinoplanes utahensis]GIF31526.1 hypothetical protein Aut01nite_45120 [Actinoplanes utahensis]